MTQNPRKKQPKKPKQTRKPPKIDLSGGPDLSDEALDKLAQVTEVDIIAATALWNSKTELPGLLDAQVIEPEQPKG